MEISEYQPPPPRPIPPEPPRKNRSKLIMGGLFAVTFLTTLGIANRHEIAEHFRHAAPLPPALAKAGKQPSTAPGPAPLSQQAVAAAQPPLKPQTSQAADNSPFR